MYPQITCSAAMSELFASRTELSAADTEVKASCHPLVLAR